VFSPQDGLRSAPNAAVEPAPLFVLPENKTLLMAYGEYNTSTCKGINPGDYTPSPEPKFGRLTYEKQEFPITNPGSCFGKKILHRVAYYTWTSTSPNDSKDKFRLTWSTPDHEISLYIDWVIMRGPRIFFGNVDVTNNLTKPDVVIGQQIILTARPVYSGQTQEWEVAPKTVGGYSATTRSFLVGKVSPTDFTKTATVFYWITTGEKKVIYSMTYKGKTYKTHATFEVDGPSDASVKTELGDVKIIPNGGVRLGIGNMFAKQGIVFDAKTGGSTKGGKLMWIQVIDWAKYTTYIPGAKGKISKWACDAGTGLDNRVPYFGEFGPSTADSPFIALLPGWSYIGALERFRMYLMFLSTKANAIPVPLGYLNWQWQGQATQDSEHNWKLISDSKNRTASAFKPGSGFPEWNAVVKNKTGFSCHFL
jgi:hypothetical protein